jgi:hypothetical protein
MQSLGDSDEIQRSRFDAALLGARNAKSHVQVERSSRHLFLTRVSGDDPLEPLSQCERRLPTAAGTIPREPALTAKLCQIVEERRGIQGPELGVYRGHAREMILEAHGAILR